MSDRPSDLESEPAPRAVAVALSDRAASGLPKIVASGRGAIAERILEIAFESGVKVREDADLAEVLAALEIGREIPLEAITVVAEILSYIYRANETVRSELARGGASYPGAAP
jgi:flagellar biosynthesis protein